MVAKLILHAAALCLILATSTDHALTRESTDTYVMRVGESRKIGRSQLLIKFLGVERDGRCPVDVSCVWAGDAVMTFEASVRGYTEALRLHTGGQEARGAKVFGRLIRVLRLEPQIHLNETIPQESYVATLSIS